VLDLANDALGFSDFVFETDEAGRDVAFARGPQRLLVPRTVVIDQRVRKLQDRRERAVIFLEPDRPGFGPIP
jgi:hypothetical protein